MADRRQGRAKLAGLLALGAGLSVEGIGEAVQA